jgi:ABC-type transport system involved in multi-copper enzyme maturation permease subunit
VKGPILRALARNALHQVLDNLVFRILAGLILVPIAFAFLVGFHQDEIVLAFGLQRWSYAELYGLVDARPGLHPREDTLEGLVWLVLDNLGGTVGVLFCVAATAFFVPRLIERGSAGVVFGKPVSRTTLYLSRFGAGLSFVLLLSGVLAGGMCLGLWLVSGYADPGILCAPLALAYVYGLTHAVSMLCGILTRSSVASLLLTLLFFVLNWTVHFTWRQHEESSARRAAAAAEEIERGAAGDEEATGPLLRTFLALHFVLPKTSDASLLARELRRRLERSAWRDVGSQLVLYEVPDGFTLERDARLAPPLPGLAELLGEPRLALRRADPTLEVSLWRRPARTEEVTSGAKSRQREEFTSSAARALMAALPVEATGDDLSFASNPRGDGVPSAREIAFDVGERTHVALVFKAGADDGARGFVFTLWLAGPRGWPGPSSPASVFGQLDSAFGLAPRAGRDEARLALDTDWRHNILFSVGSSLAFAVLVLALGAWRLERMEL